MSGEGFEGKSFLVTGATSGIGLGIAERLDFLGAKLVLVGRDKDRLMSVFERLRPGRHTAIQCDLSNEDNIQSAVEDIKNRHQGLLDGAVLSAGAHSVRPFHLSKAKNFRDMFIANVETAVMGVKIFLKQVNPAGGAIVMLSSAAAIRGGAGVSAYSASKGALVSLVKSLAVELAPKRIRVNVLLPGVVMTPMTEKFFQNLPSAQVEGIRSSHLLGIGEVSDVAAAAEFLLSSGAKWITGTEFVIDGGLTCK